LANTVVVGQNSVVLYINFTCINETKGNCAVGTFTEHTQNILGNSFLFLPLYVL